jgi:hypothetical protein
MSVIFKWVLALAFALTPIWLVLEHLSIELSETQKSVTITKQVSNKMAEQQLANGIALWRDKKYLQASREFSSLGTQELSPKLQTLAGLYRYHSAAFTQNRNADFIQQITMLPENCKQKLLFVTPGIESLAQAEQFRIRFAQDQRLNTLSICIYKVTWFDPVDISCDKDWQQSGRLGCQLLSLAEKLKRLPFTHVVMFANKGKANVHNGIMFLDRQDTYDVFIHELAHFSGFIDEYPLSQELAKRVCAGVDAPNMVFKQAEQTEADQQYWQSIGLNNTANLAVARTCDNHASQAFKASSQLTFMEYHDTAYIPKNYLIAWQKQLQKAPNQPSAHINFAQLYEQSNNLSESQYWRAKYQQYVNANTDRTNNL